MRQVLFYVTLFSLCVDAAAGQILLDHQCDLERNGVVELPQIQTRQLLDLLQPIHQRVPVDEQLPRRLRHVQVVLEELVDGEQRLLIQRVDGVLLENLLQEHLAQGGGQLIDQPANTQIFVVDDVALRIEHLADLDGDLGLFVALGQVTQMQGQGADAHEHAALSIGAQGLLDAESQWQSSHSTLIEAQTQYMIYLTEYKRVTAKL